MWDILYPYSWKIIWYIIPLWLENHTLVIHLHEIYCTFAVGKSSFKLWDPSNEFHEHLVLFHTPQFIHLVLFHTPQFIHLGWISSYNRMIIISLGIFTYTILYGFIPLWLETDMIYHTPAVRKSYIYHIPMVGKWYDISYLCGWKMIWYIIPLQLENDMIYHAPAVGKSYDISYLCGWKMIP
jgi:hypothetical protein